MGGPAAAVVQAGLQGLNQGWSQKRLLTDAQLHENLADAHATIDGLQKNLSQLPPPDPNKPGSGLAYNAVQEKLAQAIQARTALFDPSVHPNALQSLGAELLHHYNLHQSQPLPAPSTTAQPAAVTLPTTDSPVGQVAGPTLPAAPAVNVQGPAETPQHLKALAQAQLMASALPPSAMAQADQQTAIDQKQQETKMQASLDYAKSLGMSDDQLGKLKEHMLGIPQKTGTLKPLPGAKAFLGEDGKYHQPMIDTADGSIGDQEMPDGWKPAPTKENATDKLYDDYAASMNTTSDQLTPAQKAYFPRWLAMQRMVARITTSDYHWTDADGNEHATPTSRISKPMLGGNGAEPTPQAPEAGELRARAKEQAPKKTADASDAQAGQSAGAKGDRIIGNKGTPAQKKAQAQYLGDNRVANLADMVDKDRSNVLAQKQLALAIIKGAAGRVNMTEYAILTSNAGLLNKLNQWANDAKSGSLTPEILNMLIGVAHNVRDASQKELLESMKPVAEQAGAVTASGDMSDTEFLMKAGKK